MVTPYTRPLQARRDTSLPEGRRERAGGGVLDVYIDDGSRLRTKLQAIFNRASLELYGGGLAHRLLIRHREIRFHVHME